MDQVIHLAAAADDNYAPYLAVTILSAILASRPSRCAFHLVDNDLSPDRRSKIEAMVRREGADVRWYTVDAEAYQEGGLFAHVSRAAYYRVSLPDLVPAEIGRLLYLDSDLAVVRDLTPLFTLPMHGRTVAAVQDSIVEHGDYLGLEKSNGYFNSGVMLIDVRRWREQGIAARVRERILQDLPTRWADQCHLNAVLAGDWASLPNHWNYQAHKLPEGGVTRASLDDEAYEALTNPSIVHFCSGEKPWLLGCRHPYRGLYGKLRRGTPWANAPAPHRTLRSELVYLRNLVRYPVRFPVEPNA